MKSQSSLYDLNPAMPPDSDFRPGELQHLVVGNVGRLLDPRRAPVRLVAFHSGSGMAFVQEVFSAMEIERPLLFRTMNCVGPLQQWNAARSFISATFTRGVAEALFCEYDMTRTVAMY